MKKRIFAAFLTGYVAFIAIYGFITWALTSLKITAYGRFVSTFFKGRKPDEAKAFIEANKGVFEQMLPEATRFSNIVITPSVSLILGIIVGLIIASRQKFMGSVWALTVAAPLGILFWVKSMGEPDKAMYLILMLAASAIGGYIGNLIASKTYAKAQGGI
ncbi:MAG: hypothetical protein HYS21_12795 [Deltaproteobacteria bacterium]|nr:hypothetical protein [Deltaproteobacteria bacterium]